VTTAAAATPALSTWTIDPSHTEAGFAVKHLMISTVRGRPRLVRPVGPLDGFGGDHD